MTDERLRVVHLAVPIADLARVRHRGKVLKPAETVLAISAQTRWNSTILRVRRNLSPREGILRLAAAPLEVRFRHQIPERSITMKIGFFARRVGTVAFLALIAIPAAAQKYDIALDTGGVSATAIRQPVPEYPDSVVRRGQEGWARMNFVVTAAGNAVDPIIVDSSGGGGFEQEARNVVSQWEFESNATSLELPNNTVNIRFEIARGKDRARRDFVRRYRSVVTLLAYEEYEPARQQVDQAYAFGGWNLYESTMLWLMIGRVDGAEGHNTDKLEKYRRSLGVSNHNSLDGEDRRDLLMKIFELEYEHAQYAAAISTLESLRSEPDNQKEIASLQAKAAEIEQLIASGATFSAKATIYNSCDCETGTPLWSYAPVHRTFAFTNLSGNVEHFEARCDTNRIRDTIATDKTWTLPREWGSCKIFVFGDDGASFEFVEHGNTEPGDVASLAPS